MNTATGLIYPILGIVFLIVLRLIIEILIDNFDSLISNIKTFFLKRKKIKRYCNKKEYNELLQEDWFPIYSFNNYTSARQAYTQLIMTMPQLTFDRWLIFYNNKPENWIIQKDETLEFANIPYYVKKISKNKTVYLPIFWTDYKEMNKYRNWVEIKYELGNSKNFENIRDYNLEVLTNYIKKDIEERRKQIEEEYQQAKENIIKLSDGTTTTITKK